MAERDRERGALEQAASTAHTIHGAIKTGKAIASAAKGAATGGPYGAVAGAVWGARKHIGTRRLCGSERRAHHERQCGHH